MVSQFNKFNNFTIASLIILDFIIKEKNAQASRPKWVKWGPQSE